MAIKPKDIPDVIASADELPDVIVAKHIQAYVGCGRVKSYEILKDLNPRQSGRKKVALKSALLAWLENSQTTQATA